MKSPILGSSYVARSINAADNRMVNLFPEIVPEGGKEPAFLQRAPGMTASGLTAASIGPILAMLAYDNVLVIVASTITPTVYTSTNGAALVNRGGIVGITSYITMAQNDTQVFIVNSGQNTAWVLDKTTFALTQEAGPTFGPDNISAYNCTYLDGYFVFRGVGNRIYVSNLLDGTTIDPLAFANADASPDPVVRVAALNGELWVFGENTTEVWYNAGTTPFPFAPIQGSFSEMGCDTPTSVASIDNSLFWVGNDKSGRRIVYRSNGYRAERISTHAVESIISQYPSSTLLLRSYTYQQNGHSFYVLTSSSISGSGYSVPGFTWVYDITTQVWHERARWTGTEFAYHRATCTVQVPWLGRRKMFVGTDDGFVNYLEPDVYTEPGATTRWLRSWRALPTGQNNLKRTAHHALQIDCETGNNATELNVSLRWSDDGGHTFNSTPRVASLGAAGDYSKRVIFRRLGMTTQLRDRVYELSGEDSAIFIMGAELTLSPTDG